MKTILLFGMMMTVQAQVKGPQAKGMGGLVSVPKAEILASDAPEDAPEFRRKYVARLVSKAGLTMTLECKDEHYVGRNCYATIRQPDEKAVSFTVGGRYEPYDSIADKVIDPVIVPEVKRLAADMWRMDAAYRAANPREFKDSDGTYWNKKAEK